MLLCHRHLSEFQIFTPFVDRNPGDGASATPTGQAPENVALMETAQEYLDATADTSQTLCNAEFFTCPEAQPSLRSDLNDGYEFRLGYVLKTEISPGLSPHSESLTSRSGSISEEISQGIDILEANTKGVKLVESTGSLESSSRAREALTTL
ncbi:hypothetical protein EDD16DRAFT_1021624 [Pisolithus croceorrhizus]|nr:hypothetical protein EDD16DRAFT_1021624 [Pisolithus croceorrhizus]